MTERELLHELEGCQQLVAELHAAAVGEVRGPIRGVVEDVADLRRRMLGLETALRYIYENERQGGRFFDFDEWAWACRILLGDRRAPGSVTSDDLERVRLEVK